MLLDIPARSNQCEDSTLSQYAEYEHEAAHGITAALQLH